MISILPSHFNLSSMRTGCGPDQCGCASDSLMMEGALPGKLAIDIVMKDGGQTACFLAPLSVNECVWHQDAGGGDCASGDGSSSATPLPHCFCSALPFFCLGVVTVLHSPGIANQGPFAPAPGDPGTRERPRACEGMQKALRTRRAGGEA